MPTNVRDAKSDGASIGVDERCSWTTNAASDATPTVIATAQVGFGPSVMMPATVPKRPSVTNAAPSQSTAGARCSVGGSGMRNAASANVANATGTIVANATRQEPASTNQPPSIGLTAPTSDV